MERKIDNHGRITIPVKYRKELKIVNEDKLKMELFKKFILISKDSPDIFNGTSKSTLTMSKKKQS